MLKTDFYRSANNTSLMHQNVNKILWLAFVAHFCYTTALKLVAQKYFFKCNTFYLRTILFYFNTQFQEFNLFKKK